MAFRQTGPRRRRALALSSWTRALPVAAATCICPAALADPPGVAIRLSGGGGAVYAAPEIERIDFEGDTALVVVTQAGSERFATAAIARIEFLFDPAGVTDPEEAASQIRYLRLFQNRPNPFAKETRIEFDMTEPAEARLAIYAPNGRLVRVLAAGPLPKGRQAVVWDGADEAGRPVASGVYIYKLTAPGTDEARRLVVVP